MDDAVLGTTRRSLHGVAELLIAGPQYRTLGTIRLQVTPGGFGGVKLPVSVRGTTLHWSGGSAPLAGSYRELATAAGVTAGVPEGIYHDTSGVDPDEQLVVDPAAAELLAQWFERGDAALREFAPDTTPVLWPEHFDLGIAVGEANYGISPGDAGHAGPYAYVGPWTPREGAFWNASFGASRSADELPDAASVAAFLAEGRALVEG
jgi:hypothetical protein